MDGISVKIKELKDVATKLNLAIERSKINPKSGWIELETLNHSIILKVSNYDYFLKAYIPCEEFEGSIHVTISSDTFIPLISKLDGEYATFYENQNCMVLTVDGGEYTFPLIKEMGKPRELDTIPFIRTNCTHVVESSESIVSIAETNAKGLADSMYARDIQQYVYVDNIGAITFTENIYINDFSPLSGEERFKFLLSATHSKLMKIFDGCGDVDVMLEANVEYESPIKVFFRSERVELIVVTPSREVTDKFPSIKIRSLSSSVADTHVILDKKSLDKALARLMVFDKKFDITVLNYSQLVWGKDSVKLVSIKNKNYEIIPYVKSENPVEHTSMIRFADLVKQLKAITTKQIDISYGDSPAIVINGNIKQMIPEIRAV